MRDDRAVWITGVGATTPLGSEFEVIAGRLLSAEPVARTVVDRTEGGEFQTLSCVIDQIPTPRGWRESDFLQLPRVEQATLWACSSALNDAGLANETERLRIGVVLGAGAEWVREWEQAGVSGASTLYTGGETDCLVQRTQQRLGIHGPAVTISAACASANYAIAMARQWIRQGLVDVCLAGGVETLTGIGRAAFANLRALSRRMDNPAAASRPFDRDRDGFVMAEGAVMTLLESANCARRRSARVYGEAAGFGAASDAFHMIIPSNDSLSVAAAIQMALADAQIEPEQVDYVNAHATGTPVGDVAETRAMRKVFGSHVSTTPVSSTKSITGHLLSAAAGMEAVAGLAAIHHQAIPPTINLDNPDPECDLCHVPHQARAARVDVVVSNSFGFGGNNSSLVLRKVA